MFNGDNQFTTNTYVIYYSFPRLPGALQTHISQQTCLQKHSCRDQKLADSTVRCVILSPPGGLYPGQSRLSPLSVLVQLAQVLIPSHTTNLSGLHLPYYCPEAGLRKTQIINLILINKAINFIFFLSIFSLNEVFCLEILYFVLGIIHVSYVFVY